MENQIDLENQLIEAIASLDCLSSLIEELTELPEAFNLCPQSALMKSAH